MAEINQLASCGTFVYSATLATMLVFSNMVSSYAFSSYNIGFDPARSPQAGKLEIELPRQAKVNMGKRAYF